MLLISSIGIEITKDVTIDHVKRMTSFCQHHQSTYSSFSHMLWYAPAKFVMLQFHALLIKQNCNQWPRNRIKCNFRRHNSDVIIVHFFQKSSELTLTVFQQSCCLLHSGCAMQAFIRTNFRYGIEKGKEITILL